MNCQLGLNRLVDKWLNNNHTCLLCNQPAWQALPLCHACELDLPWLGHGCSHCALPMPHEGLTCQRCTYAPAAFSAVVAPLRYAFPVDALVSRFKHGKQWPLGRLLAELLVPAVQQRWDDDLPRPHVLLPVPLARRRLRQRGFNQAALLCRWLSRPLALPWQEHWLLRARHTTAQQTLDADARRRNLHGAFTLAPDAELHGLHVALVDDVMTTGATADTLAALLRQAGAARIDLYCLARTPSPGAA